MQLEIEATVLKMVIGKTDKDEREDTSGLVTKLAFDVVGSPRNLARMANLLKQGNVNTMLIIKATNAATDVKVETVNIPHQMNLDEGMKNNTSAASGNSVLDQAEDVLKAGSTPIRTGDPIVPGTVAAPGEKVEPKPIPGICINCGYTCSQEELTELTESGNCPICGKTLNKIADAAAATGNGHQDPSALAATEEKGAWDAMEQEREERESADAALQPAQPPVEVKKRRARKPKENQPV
ncbi:MAG: hypothetical protein PHG51_06415 [Candidatus Omnitrophica bacterium]|nr:hypothetical protein [Candidatus Omnitrophota bacterium]